MDQALTPASMDPIGVTTCPTCQKRFRLLKKHEPFVGKQIQCPKCNRPFVVHIELPSPIEQAAMANAAPSAEKTEPETPTSPEKQKKQNKRKTKIQIRKEYYAKIREEFRPFLKRLRAISDVETSSEEEVRRWCVDVLRTVLGHDDTDIDTEMSALNQRIDIAIKHDDKVILIIECKNVRSKLGNSSRDQAVTYAANKSADWAVVTNGQQWSLYRVIPVKGRDPRVVDVFSISLLDDDGLSPYDVERMFLLTQRALLRGETEREFHKAQCLDNQRLLKAITAERSIRVIRKTLIDAYRKEFGEKPRLDSEDVLEALQEVTRPDEL